MGAQPRLMDVFVKAWMIISDQEFYILYVNVNSHVVSYWEGGMYPMEKVAGKKIYEQLSHSRMSHTFVCPFVLHSGWTEMLPSNCAVWNGLLFMVVWIALIVSTGEVKPVGSRRIAFQLLKHLRDKRHVQRSCMTKILFCTDLLMVVKARSFNDE